MELLFFREPCWGLDVAAHDHIGPTRRQSANRRAAAPPFRGPFAACWAVEYRNHL
jgi:hypothetical protein